jgi:hypothetical protein
MCFFGGDMVNSRSYIRLLRHLGIALIFAPEPFTTPFGVACIVAARHLSKQHETKLNNRLRETVQYYLAHTSSSRDYIVGASPGPGPSKRTCCSDEHPILGQISGSGGFAAKSLVRKGRQSMRENPASHSTDIQNPPPRYKHGAGFSYTPAGTQKVIYHTIDVEWLSRRYESASIAMAHSYWTTSSGNVESAAHRSLDMGLLSHPCGTGKLGQVKAKSIAINVTELRQRCEPTASYKMVHRALQNTNHHYDMSSRKNVIEGH